MSLYLPSGDPFQHETGKRRLDRIRETAYKIMDLIGLEVFRGQSVERAFKYNQSGIPEVFQENFSVIINNINDIEDIDIYIDYLESKFGVHLTSSKVEILTHFRKKMMLQLYLRRFLIKNNITAETMGAFYDKVEGKPDWIEIYTRLTEYLSKLPEGRNIKIPSSDVAAMFDESISLNDFKEKIAVLLSGSMIIPVELLFESHDSQEDAVDVYTKAQYLESKGFDTLSVINPQDSDSGNLSVRIPPRPSELIYKYFNIKRNFYQIAEENPAIWNYPFNNSLFAKFMIYAEKLLQERISLGTIFDYSTLSFESYDDQEPENARIRFVNADKLAEFNEEDNNEIARYFKNLMRDISDIIEIIKSIYDVNLFTTEERINCKIIVNWYCNTLENLVRNLKVDPDISIEVSPYRRFVKGNKTYGELLKELRSIFDRNLTTLETEL